MLKAYSLRVVKLCRIRAYFEMAVMSMAQGVKKRMANLICGLELWMTSMKFLSVFSGDDEPITSAVVESIFLSARNLVRPRPREPFFMVGRPRTLVASDMGLESVGGEKSLEMFARCEIPSVLQISQPRSSGGYLSLSPSCLFWDVSDI